MSATITRQELAAEIDAGTVTVVEALGSQYFEQGRLPGAVNVPHTEVAELAPSLLPDKDAAIVVYCSNLQCQNSAIAQGQLLRMGYTVVRKYAAGK